MCEKCLESCKMRQYPDLERTSQAGQARGQAHPAQLSLRWRQDSMTDAEEIGTILIDEARGQIALQSSNADSHDSKALALLGADIAAGLAIVSLHAVQTSGVPPGIFDRFWWIPIVGAVLSALAFSFTLWNRDFRIGPAPDTFYANHIFQTSLLRSTPCLPI